MRDFQIAIDIEASPDIVWPVMRDGERWPEWTPTVTSIKLLDPKPLRIGSRAVIRQPKLPPARWVITELDDARRSFTWVNAAPGVRVIAKHWVEATARGSRAHLSLRFDGLFGGLVGRLTRNINQSYLALEANGLKKKTEAMARQPARG